MIQAVIFDIFDGEMVEDIVKLFIAEKRLIVKKFS